MTEVLRAIRIPWRYRGYPVFMQVIRLSPNETGIRIVFPDGTPLSKGEYRRMEQDLLARRTQCQSQ